MKHVRGVSAFGLNDCVAYSDKDCRELGFYLADTVLPINPFGRIRTGDKTEDKRTHAGLYWPPEARIKVGEPLRRAPISYVWRALVEAGDRIARWNVGRGVSFPLPRILANHVACLLANGSHKQSASHRDNKLVDSTGTVPVVAIPDNLDEFGQWGLICEPKRPSR